MRNFFKWAQIAHAIPSNWKSLVRNSTFDRGTCCLDQHLVMSEKMLPVVKLNSRIFYDVLVVKLSSPPTSQKYFERQFGHNLKWVDIYGLPHLVTSDSRTGFFQFKLSHNILFLKSRLFHLNHVPNPLCSLCNNFNETPSHFFCESLVVVGLCNEVRAFLAHLLFSNPSRLRVPC